MSIVSLFKRRRDRRCEVASIVRPITTLHKQHVPLVVEHMRLNKQYYCIIDRLNQKKNFISVVDLTPDSDLLEWKKKDVIKISSVPRAGKTIEFTTIVTNQVSDNSFCVDFPSEITVIDRRVASRVVLSHADQIQVNLYVDSCDVLLNELPDLTANKCQYIGRLYDISKTGIQIRFDEDMAGIIRADQEADAEIIGFDQQQMIRCELAVRWTQYDKGGEHFDLGGSFVNIDENNTRSLNYFLSELRSKYYHRYI